MSDNPTSSPKRRHVWAWAGIILVFVVGLGWEVVARASSLRLFQVPSFSMAPAIQPGDRVCVDSVQGQSPRRGEIWTFSMPAAITGFAGLGIKRVVGMPGETIAVEGGKVTIDGRAIAEPYLAAPIAYTMAARTLATGEYFMLGDNRNVSMDSHVWGPVPVERMHGRVLYRVWPWDRAGGL